MPATSWRRQSANATVACLLATYADSPVYVTRPEMDAMTTMCPEPPAEQLGQRSPGRSS